MSKLIMYRGDSTVLDVAIVDENSAPVDITTGTLYFTVKSNARQADVDAVLQKSSGSGISVTNGPLGLAQISLSPADTASAFAPQTYVWDLQYTTAGGAVSTVATGELLLKADITLATGV